MGERKKMKKTKPAERLRSEGVRGYRVRKYVNGLFWVATLSGIGTVGFLTKDVYSNFKESQSWEKNSKVIPMAQQSIDMLYDSSKESRESKKKFTLLYNSMIRKDGLLKKEATLENVNKLNDYLKKIEGSGKDRYTKRFEVVRSKFTLEEQYKSMFIDGRTIKAEFTPQRVALNYKANLPLILDFFNANHNDKYVKMYLKNQEVLMNDVYKLAEIEEVFFTSLTIDEKKEEVRFKTSFIGDLENEINEMTKELTYSWESLAFILEMASNMRDKNDELISADNLYNQYLEDMRAFETEKANWEGEKATFLANVERIKEEAIKMEEDRLKKEEEVKEFERMNSLKKSLINEIRTFSKLSEEEIYMFIERVDKSTSESELEKVRDEAIALNKKNHSVKDPEPTTPSEGEQPNEEDPSEDPSQEGEDTDTTN